MSKIQWMVYMNENMDRKIAGKTVMRMYQRKYCQGRHTKYISLLNRIADIFLQ